MIAKVSSCLLPGGGDGDDECEMMELQHCSCEALSFYHICIHPRSHLSHHSRLKQICPFTFQPVLVTIEQMDPAIILLSSQQPVQSGSNLSVQDCHIVTPSTLACNSQSESSTMGSPISYEKWEPSPSLSSPESNDPTPPRTPFGWENPQSG